MNSISIDIEEKQLEVLPGEIVQVIESSNYNLSINLIGEEFDSVIHRLISGTYFKFQEEYSPKTKIQDIIDLWGLNDIPIHLETIYETLGLEEVLSLPVDAICEDIFLRLEILKALIDRVEIIEFAVPEKISHFPDLLIDLIDLRDQFDDYNPAFVIRDEEEILGVSWIANRILSFEEGYLEELLIDF